MTSTPVSASPAATVVVLRPHVSAPFDVLLVRRSDQVAFMAGAYVFPGGRVDDTDAPEPREACDGVDLPGRYLDLTPDDEARCRVAGIRELLEEAGILLARRGTAFVDNAEAMAIRASAVQRTSIVAHLAARGLRPALDAVMPFAHWVTPDIEIRRFDTRFLLARVPEGQDASHDAGETTALEWLTPAEAIGRAARREMMLPPPTWITLDRLSRFSSIDDAWHWASSVPMVRIQPGFVHDDEGRTLVLPGDPTFPAPAGCERFDVTRFRLVTGGGWAPLRP